MPDEIRRPTETTVSVTTVWCGVWHKPWTWFNTRRSWTINASEHEWLLHVIRTALADRTATPLAVMYRIADAIEDYDTRNYAKKLPV